MTTQPERPSPVARVPGGQRALSAFVVIEVTLAMILLTFGATLLRNLRELRRLDLGLDGRGVMTAVLELPRGRFSSEEVARSHAELLADLTARADLSSAGLTSTLPLSGSRSTTALQLEGHTDSLDGRLPVVEYSVVSPGFFETLGIPTLTGRTFAPGEGEGSPRPVVVNRALAGHFWPGQSALGRQVAKGGPDGGWVGEIVGVVGDVSYHLEEDPAPHLYWSLDLDPRTSVSLLLRGTGDTLPSAALLRREVRRWRSEAQVYDIRSMEDWRSERLSDRTFAASLLGVLSLVAVILAWAGAYGTLSFWVSRHRRELGVRMAVGATRAAVAGLVLTRAAILVGIGLLAGTLLAGVLDRILGSLLQGIETGGPGSVVLGATSLGLVALVASALPALRASRIQPAEVVRSL